MDFSQNSNAYFTKLPSSLTGVEKFLAVAAYVAKGLERNEIATQQIKSLWRKSILKVSYNPAYYNHAQKKGWVDPVRPGVLVITEQGIEHLSNLVGESPSTRRSSGLHVFNQKNTHSFDKFLRTALAGAQKRVWLADSYVDETIFDNVLDSVDQNVQIRLLYGRQYNSFIPRSARFKSQYAKYEMKEYKKLHDRFLIIDDVGYIIGPSIKDAANKSPALVVKLGDSDSKTLVKFFQSIW